MANPIVRKDQSAQPTEWSLTETEPFRAVRRILEWDPFREMAPFRWAEERPAAFSPAFEVRETQDGYLFKADVPGVSEKDIDISLTDSRLTISGKRDESKEEGGETYYACERSYGSFTRAFTLPDGADTDHIRSELKDGVLTIAIGKLPQVKTRQIPISRSS